MSLRSSPLLVLPLLLAAPPAGAQETPADTARAPATLLPEGARVRVHLDVPPVPDPDRIVSVSDLGDAVDLAVELSRPVGPPVVGTVGGWRADTLLLRLGDRGASAAVPAPLILRLEVSRGTPSHAEGAVRGALRGVLGGLALGLTAHGVASLAGDAPSFGDMLRAGVVVGVLGGALEGGLSPRERWRDVPLSLVRPPGSSPPPPPSPAEEDEEEDDVEEVETVIPPGHLTLPRPPHPPTDA